jgi:hypothetical protein
VPGAGRAGADKLELQSRRNNEAHRPLNRWWVSMTDVRAQISRLLDLARRARRLAPHFDGDDRARLLTHAEELEQDAAALRDADGANDGDISRA